MEEANCVWCGKSFPLTIHNRQTCSKFCAHRQHNKVSMQNDRQAINALKQQPLYTKTELYEARVYLSTYTTPELSRGREYLLEKSKRIVEYWKERERMEMRIIKLRNRSRVASERYLAKKKEMKNVQTTQPVS
jgi:hypothetical protein